MRSFPSRLRPALWLLLAPATLLACASRAGAPPAAAPVAAAAAPAADPPLAFDPQFKIGTLPNGLRYYERPNREPQHRVFLRLLIDAGSVLERDDQQGLAHFLEHMAFDGTRLFKPKEIFNFMEKVGMRSGQHTNAATGFDETHYRFEVPGDDPAVVHTALQMLEQMAGEIRFDPVEVERERRVVIEENRLFAGAEMRIRRQLMPVLFQGSLYGDRLPIGKLEVLQKASADDLRAFYRRWYRPDRMAVLAVGDFDPGAIEKEIVSVFGLLPRPAAPTERPIVPIPDHERTLVALARDKEVTDTQVWVYQMLPARALKTRPDVRGFMVEQLYHRMFNARLEELSRGPSPPFLGAVSTTQRYVRQKDLVVQAAGVKQGQVAAGLSALTRELQRVDRFGFVAGELQRQKVDLLSEWERAVREKDKTHSEAYLARASAHFLRGDIEPPVEEALPLLRQLLPTISVEEMNRVASRWISPRNRVLFVRAPEEGAVPPAAELMALAERSEHDPSLKPYVDQVTTGPLVDKLPPAGPVVQSRQIPELGVTEWRLRNGARVVVKPTDFKNDQLLARAVSAGGHSRVAAPDYQSALRAADIVQASGVGRFDRTQLDKALAGKLVSAGPYLDELEEGLIGAAAPDDLETLLQLFHLYFTAPRRDPVAYAALMAQARETVERRTADPDVPFWDRWQTVFFSNHPRRRPPDLQQLDQVSLDRALRVYKERFANAADFTFFFVGRVQPDRLQPLVERYLGSLPARGARETWRDVGARPPAGKKRVEVRSGQDPKSTVVLTFAGESLWSRLEDHLVDSVREALKLRLTDVLRLDLGATYDVSVEGGLFRRPYQGRDLRVQFSCAPENVERLTAAVYREIRGAQTGGFPADILTKVKAAQTRALEEGLRNNDYWADQLIEHYRSGSDPRLILQEQKLIDALDAPALQAAARRYFDEKRQLVGLHLPAAAASAPAASR